ncbi:hypothetical protein [Hyphococcus luteus]|nr:hypothetical protein [Marinicaulis flavus]
MPEIRRVPLPENPALICAGNPAFFYSWRTCAGCLAPSHHSTGARLFLLLAPPEGSGIAGRLGELAGFKFLERLVFSPFPEKFLLKAQGSGAPSVTPLNGPCAARYQLPGIWPMDRAGRKRIFTLP